jgi:hypothetical protein
MLKIKFIYKKREKMDSFAFGSLYCASKLGGDIARKIAFLTDPVLYIKRSGDWSIIEYVENIENCKELETKLIKGSGFNKNAEYLNVSDNEIFNFNISYNEIFLNAKEYIKNGYESVLNNYFQDVDIPFNDFIKYCEFMENIEFYDWSKEAPIIEMIKNDIKKITIKEIKLIKLMYDYYSKEEENYGDEYNYENDFDNIAFIDY